MNISINELDNMAAIAELFLKTYYKAKSKQSRVDGKASSKKGLSKIESVSLLSKRQSRINKITIKK